MKNGLDSFTALYVALILIGGVITGCVTVQNHYRNKIEEIEWDYEVKIDDLHEQINKMEDDYLDGYEQGYNDGYEDAQNSEPFEYHP